MATLFTNNAVGLLASTVTASSGDTEVELGAGEGDLFPVVTALSGNIFYCTLISTAGAREIVKCTLRASGNILEVVRAQEGTAAQAFGIGDKCQLRVTAVTMTAFETDIGANTAAIVANDADIATNVADIAALDARVAVNETDLAGTTNAGSVPAPSGTVMWFGQPAAPPEWTITTAGADRLLAVSGGSEAYNVAGGQLAGQWAPTVHNHTGPSHIHTMPSHIHTMPSHSHTMPSHKHTGPSHSHTVDIWSGSKTGTVLSSSGSHTRFGTSSGEASWYYLAGVGNVHVGKRETTAAGGTGDTSTVDPGDTNSKDPGDTNSTDPGDTNAGGTAVTGDGSAPSSDRPAAIVGIIATKD